jgi:hypothetical protein
MNKCPHGKALFLRALLNDLGFARLLASRFAQITALAFLAAAFTTTPTYAQSNAQGSVLGRVVGVSASDLAGATVTLSNKEFNISRTAPVSSAGTFEFPSVPVGDYEVTLVEKGHEPVPQTAHVGLGNITSVRFEPGSGETMKLDKFVVTGADASPVDVASTVIGLNLRSETVELLPVPRNITGVSLLTPGVTAGDRGFFGNLASFAGASVGENAYYLNGFNITDFRRGLGYQGVPFEFFSEFQTLTSGYSAEFGRSTGGVVNAISKRGTNEYHASVGVIWEPDSLTSDSPNTYGATDGKAYVINSKNVTDTKTYNIEASGPIWKNHLYFYGLYQGNRTTLDFMANSTSSRTDGTTITQLNHRTNNSPFWSGKLDWQILKDHAFEFTTFSDKSDEVQLQYPYAWTSANGSITFPSTYGTPSTRFRSLGGRGDIYRYSGNFFDNVLTLTALYGKNSRDSSVSSTEDAAEYIVDNRSSAGRLSGSSSVTDDVDRRKAKRVDGTVRFNLLGSHSLKFGYDNETNTAHSLVHNSGSGTSYEYNNYSGGALENGVTPPAGTTQIASLIVYKAGGDFRVITEAEYVEDNWKLMNDRLNLNLGLRREMLDNRNGNDKTFIKIEDMKAPRLSGSYDLKGDGLSHVFASWGRYFLQIPANTDVRMAGGETYYTDYYVLNSLKPDNLPNLGPQVGPRVTTSNGIVPGVETLVNANIAPMYQDEWTIGYEKALNKLWKGSVKFIYRNLASTIEDEAVDAALLKYAASKNYSTFNAEGFDYYVLTNPGAPITFYINMTKDLNADGVVNGSDQSGGIATKDKITLDAASLGYPKASRKYYSVYLDLERAFADKWFAHFSYVWMHSYGNYEGSVYSDIGQRDAGITQLFDQPGLVDGAYGPLPNDRRHTFKAFGAYQFSKAWTLSGNFSLQSGRPKNGLGAHPTDLFARAYGASSYYVDGILTPRGSLGRTPWVTQLDLALRYKPTWGDNKLTLGVDVFNVPNFSTQTAIFERSTSGATSKLNFYQQTRLYQQPRYVRLSASYDY